MASQWYCRLMGTELGPFTSKQLLEMASCPRLTPDDSVKKGADGMWVAAHRVKGLFDDASASTIIIASLPPEVKQALESKRERTREAAALEPRPIKWYYISVQNKVGPLDFDELVADGAFTEWQSDAWQSFRRDPFRSFLYADDETKDIIWNRIQARQSKRKAAA